jgi:hypothetical protein
MIGVSLYSKSKPFPYDEGRKVLQNPELVLQINSGSHTRRLYQYVEAVSETWVATSYFRQLII